MHRTPTALRTALVLSVVAVAGLAGGCTWVELTGAGEGVRVGTAAEAASCEKLGATHSKTSDTVWVFARSEKKVAAELEALARNEAAEMGGNLIVPRGPVTVDGRRSFDVYRCPSP